MKWVLLGERGRERERKEGREGGRESIIMYESDYRYCQELYPDMPVWGYEDLALASFGAVGKVRK